MRALRIHNDTDLPQVADAVLLRWATRRRELLLVDRLDRLTTVLERLVAVLARRAA